MSQLLCMHMYYKVIFYFTIRSKVEWELQLFHITFVKTHILIFLHSVLNVCF